MGNNLPQRSNAANSNPSNQDGATRIPLNLFDQPQNQDHENKILETLTNDYIVHKEKMQLKAIANRDKKYSLTFAYSSPKNVYITVYFQATLEKELITGKIKSISLESGSPHPKQYKCPAGLNQSFPDDTIKIDLDLYGGTEKLTSHTESKYPLIITIEPADDDVFPAVRNVYLFTFMGNDKNELTKVQLVKQKLEVGEETYEIDDIYIASADNPENQTLNTGNVTCIVCYGTEAQILLYPCRHLCLCETCANKVRQELKVCPVCRKNVERFFPVQLSKKPEESASAPVVVVSST